MNLFYSKLSNNKAAFTLAEVLITLVIIGVIAALTIPTAINNTKEQELKSQFAKAYSTIVQAQYKTVMNDFGGYVKCYDAMENLGTGSSTSYSAECSSFIQSLEKNLQVQKICRGNSKSDGCVPEYPEFTAAYYCSGATFNSLNNSNYAYVLASGQIISLSVSDSSFLMDINGHKGPNAYGKDLFAFSFARGSHGAYFVHPADCTITPVKGGRKTEQMMRYALAGKK